MEMFCDHANIFSFLPPQILLLLVLARSAIGSPEYQNKDKFTDILQKQCYG